MGVEGGAITSFHQSKQFGSYYLLRRRGRTTSYADGKGELGEECFFREAESSDAYERRISGSARPGNLTHYHIQRVGRLCSGRQHRR